jgi:SAM-dependent methyltransferase
MAAETEAQALARLYDLDLTGDPGDVDLYRALAARADGPVVELAVGSGRIAIRLAEDGRDVVGIDLDPAMLDRARARQAATRRVRSGSLELIRGDMLEVRPPAAGTFGLAILALNSIMVLPSRDAQRRAVAVMGSLVGPGGIVAIDAWQPDAEDLVRFDGRLALEWIRRDPSTGRDVTKVAAAWFDAPTRTVTLTTIFEEAAPGDAPLRWTRSDVLRLVSADELRGFAADAGLEVEVVGADYELTPLGSGADRAILVARRPG